MKVDPSLDLCSPCAQMSYEAVTDNVSVVLKYPPEGALSALSFVVDSKTILSEMDRIGFAGATGTFYEVHKIFSWSFNFSYRDLNGRRKNGA